MSKENVSKKSKGKIKKIMAGFMVAVLLVGGTILGTLAFLKTTSETVTNTFTASSDISLGLDEPNYNDKNGDGTPDDANKPNPANYQPETTYTKDPTLYNLTGTAGTSKEWVAMRVDYGIKGSSSTVEAVSYEQLTHNKGNGCADFNGKCGILDPISFDNTNWIRLSASQIKELGGLQVEENTIKYEIFIYKYKLTDSSGITTLEAAKNNSTGLAVADASSGGKTTPLFPSITIKNKQTLMAHGYSSNNLLSAPQFKIIARGGAVKDDSTVATDFTTINSADFTSTSTDSYEIASELVKVLSAQTVNFN